MIRLADIVANRAWLRREYPFPHVSASNVFKPAFYEALAEQIRTMLSQGLSETPASTRFSRSIPGYDSYGLGFDLSVTQPVSLFVSAEWRDMMNRLFNVGVTPYVFAGAHHHIVGSRSGFVHNDFNPVWFPRSNEAGVQVPASRGCSYTRGQGSLPEAEKVQVVRAVVVLYFLLNHDWRMGDGGEIGFFSSAEARVSEPVLAYPPINNSLVMFECTPQSFHSFISNLRLPRTSIIMWTHRTMEEAAGRFGQVELEHWKT